MIQSFVKIPLVSQEERQKILKSWIKSIEQHGAEQFLGWFFGAKIEQVYQGNVVEFLAGVLYNTSPPRLQSCLKEEILQMIKNVEKALNHQFQKGYNLNVRCMRNSMDPVKTEHRPLIFYVIVILLDYFSRMILLYKGFQLLEAGSTRYYYRPGKQGRHSAIKQHSVFQFGSKHSKRKHYVEFGASQPVVFLHGLGIGLIFNIGFALNIIGNRESFIVELPWVSCRLGESIPKPEEFVETIEFMLTRHGLWTTGACFVGHSYGTIATTWVLKYRRELVSSLIFLEPVCLQLYNYNVCYNFLYRTPNTITMLIARYFAGLEIGTALAMTRYFWWQYNICLFEDLPQYSAIFLAKHDFLMDTIKIREWLASHPESNEYHLFNSQSENKNNLDSTQSDMGFESYENQKNNQKKSNKLCETMYLSNMKEHGQVLISLTVMKKVKNCLENADEFLQGNLRKAKENFPRKPYKQKKKC